MTHELIVESGAASRRLDVYLAAQLGWSRTAVAAAIKAGAVSVDGHTGRASQPVVAGEAIIVTKAESSAPLATVPPPQLPIVFEDDDILVVDKPAGITVHAGNTQPLAGTVAHFAQGHTTDDDPDRPGIVHRLDKETSGLLLIAKSESAKLEMGRRWRAHEVKKTYRLLATGRVEPAAAVIDLPTGRDHARPTRRSVQASGRPSVTRYQTLAAYPGYTYLEAYPETGRTHQLRVHFAATGHPIAGDLVYGIPKRQLGLTRHFLHAAGLSFVTPSGETVEITSELPAELMAVLARLEEVA